MKNLAGEEAQVHACLSIRLSLENRKSKMTAALYVCPGRTKAASAGSCACVCRENSRTHR